VTSAHARRVLDQLVAERSTARATGVAHNVTYMHDLEAARDAYVGLAVTAIARLYGELYGGQVGLSAARLRPDYASRPAHTLTVSSGKPTFVATSHAAWSSFSVQTSRTTMIAPSRSIVQPACSAAASSAGRCSSSSNPSGNVTSNGSDPSGWSPSATRQA
jgi:hypothetical protein